MMEWKHKLHIRWGISLVSFLVIIIVDQTVYKGVWPSTLPIILLVTHTLYFREAMKEKRKIPYWIFALLFLTILYFSLPKYSYNQAKDMVMDKHEIISEKQQIIPVMDSGFHPFALTHFYSFKIRALDAEQRVMVNPDTGEIIVLR